MEMLDRDVMIEFDCKLNTRADDPLCAVVFQDIKVAQRLPKSPVTAFTAWKVFEIASSDVHLIRYPKDTGMAAEIYFPDCNKTFLLTQPTVKPGSKWIIVEAAEAATDSSTGEDSPSSMVVMREGEYFGHSVL